MGRPAVTETAQEKARRSRLKRLYNITPEEYDLILEYQGGGCAICGRPPGKTRLAVDHNHTSGLTRGLLCWQHNAGLAKFGDSLEYLRNGALYIHRPPATLALGEPRYGRTGRVTTRVKRKKRRTK